SRRERLGGVTRVLRSMLDAPRRLHQAHLAEQADWERRREAVLGPADAAGTIAAIERVIAELEELPTKLDQLRAQRRQIALAIHAQLGQVVDLHQRAYAPVQRFIAEHELAR